MAVDARRYTRPCECGCGGNVNPRPYRSQLMRFIAGHSPVRNAWTAEADAFLRENYQRLTAAEIGAHVGKSAEAVKSHAEWIGIQKFQIRTLAGWFDHYVPERPDGCWVWLGPRTGRGKRTAGGYGVLDHATGHWLAHRLSLYLANGRLPRDKDVLHTCDNPSCANPKHLYLGDDRQNMHDRASRGRDPNQKLTPEAVREIRAAIATQGDRPATHRALAAKYGCTAHNIKTVARGKSWAWVA